jgi:DNA transformation protein and related proteins
MKVRRETNTAQMFDERGRGLILRGARAQTETKGRHPYLTAADADDLVTQSITAYKAHHKHVPARVVVLKTSRFRPEEAEGIDAALAEFLREQLAPLGRVTMRRMFGKTGVFCDGVMLGMVTENTLYFRVDDNNRVMFKEAESFPPLNYEKRGSTIDLSFWRVPERLFDEPDELVTGRAQHWRRRAALRRKRERTAPKRKSKPQST